MGKQLTTAYIEEKLLKWLDEAWDDYCYGGNSEFVLGKIYAYVEVLEEMLSKEGASDESLLDLERQYGIR